MESIEFLLVNPALMSTNDMYMHPVRKCKDGRYRSYVCKAPYLKTLQEYYKDKLSTSVPDEFILDAQEFIKIQESSGLELTIQVGIPSKEIYEHDVSNFIKSLEDCISTRLSIDDSRNIKVSIEKLTSHDDNWYLKVYIGPYSIKSFEGGFRTND